MSNLDLLADAMRYAVFALSGIGVGFMLMTNFLAFKVLRPPKRLGFLWWHVTAISLSIMMIGAVALSDIVDRIGGPFTWRAPVMFVGTLLYATAQVIIFRVERQRLVAKRGFDVALSSISTSGP